MNKLFYLVMVVFIHGCNPARKQIILLDSGISKSEIPAEFLCEYGHRSFIKENDDPLKDETGHGTVLARILVEMINPKEYCIMSYKVFPGYPYPEAYAQALTDIAKTNASAVVIAIEDSSYYLKEPEWLTEILIDKKVYIAAGNGGKNLSITCDVYPACLSINSPNLHIVGADTFEFNQFGPINNKAYPHFFYKGHNHSGTSISTARAVGLQYGSRKR